MTAYVECSNGLSVRLLYDWLTDFIDAHGDDGEVWVGDGLGHSNQAVEAWRLNENDVLLDINDYRIERLRSM